MMMTPKKLLAAALIAGTALATGCTKKTNNDSDQVAKTRDTDRRIGAANDRYDDRNKDTLAPPPATVTPEASANPNPSGATAKTSQGSAMPDTSINTEGTKGSPEIAYNGPQGTAVAPNTDVLPPDNTVAGANNPTGPSPVNDQAKGMEISRSTAFGQQGTDTTTTVANNGKANTRSDLNNAKNDLDKAVNKDLVPSDTSDPQAKREAAYGQAAERLAKLDARVSEIRARVDGLANKTAFTETLTDLRRLHETAQSSLDQLRDRNVKLDDAREAADRQMTQFEAAINSVQKRIEKAASQT